MLDLAVLRLQEIVFRLANVTNGRTLQSATTNWLHGSWSASFANFSDGFVGSVPVELGRPMVLDTDELTAVRNYLYEKYSTTDYAPDLGAENNTVLHGEVGSFRGGDDGDELVVDNLHLPELQNGISNGGEFGGFYVGTFVAGDDSLNIGLGGQNPRAADNLPTLSGVTLERVDSVVLGDFNGNGMLDADDINALATEAALGNHGQAFDLNGDAVVDSEDVRVWAKDLRNTWIGDANLDGEFNSNDFVTIFQDGKFERDEDANWSQGDWNGDGRFSSSDLVVAFQDGGFEVGPVGAASPVPEPSMLALLLSAVLLVGRVRIC